MERAKKWEKTVGLSIDKKRGHAFTYIVFIMFLVNGQGQIIIALLRHFLIILREVYLSQLTIEKQL